MLEFTALLDTWLKGDRDQGGEKKGGVESVVNVELCSGIWPYTD